MSTSPPPKKFDYKKFLAHTGGKGISDAVAAGAGGSYNKFLQAGLAGLQGLPAPTYSGSIARNVGKDYIYEEEIEPYEPFRTF